MNLNKNKVILAVFGVIILLLILFVAATLGSDSSNNTTSQIGKYKVWLYQDEVSAFQKVFEDFKVKNPSFSSVSLEVDSFDSYEEYNLALAKSFIDGTGPDLFMLNNNEKENFLDGQIQAISADILDPSTFRKVYKGIFADDLILSIINENEDGGEIQEFLKGVPVGYETLGVYFNRRFIKTDDLSSISTLNNAISELKQRQSSVIPLGLGNGTTVYDSVDIATQFFMLNGNMTSVNNLGGNELQQGLGAYFIYGTQDTDNGYNEQYSRLQASGENNLDLFSKGEVQMVVGYPRMLQEIIQRGYSKNFLLASPFPHYISGNGFTLANYNYFVKNKDSQQEELSNSLLQYLASQEGASLFLEKYSYYLPALLSLESDFEDTRVDPGYNILREDFYNGDHQLASFDKGIKYIYDEKIESLLDAPQNYLSLFESFRKKIVCQKSKIVIGNNLSNTCNQ